MQFFPFVCRTFLSEIFQIFLFLSQPPPFFTKKKEVQQV